MIKLKYQVQIYLNSLIGFFFFFLENHLSLICDWVKIYYNLPCSQKRKKKKKKTVKKYNINTILFIIDQNCINNL